MGRPFLTACRIGAGTVIASREQPVDGPVPWGPGEDRESNRAEARGCQGLGGRRAPRVDVRASGASGGAAGEAGQVAC